MTLFAKGSDNVVPCSATGMAMCTEASYCYLTAGDLALVMGRERLFPIQTGSLGIHMRTHSSVVYAGRF